VCLANAPWASGVVLIWNLLPDGCIYSRTQGGSLMVEDYAIQIPWWAVVPVVLVVALGVWKLAKLLWAMLGS
jgi:hypothetical protein